MKNLKIQLLQRLIYFWDVVFTVIDMVQLKVYIKMKAKLSDLEAKQHIKVTKTAKTAHFFHKTSHDVTCLHKNNKNDILSMEDIQKNWDNLQNKPKIKIKRGCGGLK